MQSEFFKQHVQDELENAKEYMEMALELKSSHPAWSRVMFDMSDAAVKHAEKLNRVMDEYHKDEVHGRISNSVSGISSDDYDSAYKDIVGNYSRYMPEIKSMRELYMRK